ncbi:hypothetical protein IWW45_004109 [Coemansia sp. RSA 485]|nr:hypothetical protein IWW45_004109 [Coemansia sp. RSA 485]
MATIYSLPPLLIKSFILLLLRHRADRLGKWKQKLPIIGVCQLWRHFGLSLVYNQAFFVDYELYLHEGNALRQQRGQYLYRCGKPQLTKPVLVSNVDLLTMVDRCYLVGEIVLYVPNSEPQHLFLDELYRVLRQTKGNWVSVRIINIGEYWGFFQQLTNFGLSNMQDEQYDLEPILHYAKQNFPALIVIEQAASNSLLDRFGAALGNILIHRICYIRSRMSQLCGVSYMPQHITGLDLCFDKTDAILQLPIIFVASLRSLILSNLPPRFDWTCFQNPEPPHYTNVTFASLFRLSVLYRANYDKTGKLVYDSPGLDDRPDIKMVFPSLKSLSIENCSRNSSLVHAGFPSDIHNAAFSGSISSIALCQQLNIDGAYIGYNITSAYRHEEPLFYKTTNGIFANRDKRAKVTLHFESIYFSINVDMVDWNTLRSLEMDFPIQFSSFILLFQKLTGLKTLMLSSDSVGALLDTLDYNTVDKCCQTRGFALSLLARAVYFDCELDPYKYQKTLDLVTFVLAFCPGIQEATVDYMLKDDIEAFVGKRSSAFPHLEEIAICSVVFVGDLD